MWRISLLESRRVSRGGEAAVLTFDSWNFFFFFSLSLSTLLYRTVFPDYVFGLLYIDCLISI